MTWTQVYVLYGNWWFTTLARQLPPSLAPPQASPRYPSAVFRLLPKLPAKCRLGA